MIGLKNPVNGKTLPEWMLNALIEEKQTELKICRSAAGYYIGSMCQDGQPNFRASASYFSTRETAEGALKTGIWTVKQNP